jgi:hypothetical protein
MLGSAPGRNHPRSGHSSTSLHRPSAWGHNQRFGAQKGGFS